MKILKKAEQKNFTINHEYYTVNEINNMLATKEIFYFGVGCETKYEPVGGWELDDHTYRIFSDNLAEVKVILDEDKFYATVAIGKNGKTYFVNI